MKKGLFVFVLLLCGAVSSHAQTIELTHFAFSATSNFAPYSGKIEIQDSVLVFTAYSVTDSTADSTVTREKIVRKKNGYVKTLVSNGANNYEYALSDDKKEKKAGICYVSVLFVHNNGNERRTFIFKGKLLD